MLACSKLLAALPHNYPSVSLCAQSLLALVVFQKLPSARLLVSFLVPSDSFQCILNCCFKTMLPLSSV